MLTLLVGVMYWPVLCPVGVFSSLWKDSSSLPPPPVLFNPPIPSSPVRLSWLLFLALKFSFISVCTPKAGLFWLLVKEGDFYDCKGVWCNGDY